MSSLRALITDHGFPNLQQVASVFRAAGIERVVAPCQTPEAVIIPLIS